MYADTRIGGVAAASAIALGGLLSLALPSALASSPTSLKTSNRGPRAVATAQIQYSHDDELAPVDLYYPVDGPPAPPVVLLPSGHTGGPEHHVGHGQHLASWGYAVAVVHHTPFGDGVDVALNAARASAALTAVLEADVLAGRLTDRPAVLGTHFNGSSATRAAVDDPRFKAVVGLHPALHPAGFSGADELTVPTLVLGGNIEGGLLCVYGRTWQTLYYSTGSPHKSVYLFPDARPADFQEPPYSGAFNFCGKARAEPFPWIRGMMTAWLEYYLRGDTGSYSLLYGEGGAPKLPDEASDVVADNYPRGLQVAAVGESGAELTWRSAYTDTTVLDGFEVMVARAGEPYVVEERLPLEATSWNKAGLEAGTTYRFTVAYRDHAGHVFQTAEPVELLGGAPTPTPTRTRRPTATSRPTRTASPTATITPPPSPTATESTVQPQLYLPRLVREPEP